MLRVSDVSKSYDGVAVLRDVSFVLSRGERSGLVGPNGGGKTTLLRLIAGLERPDTGSVWLDPADSVAYLPQADESDGALPVREALRRGAGRVAAVGDRVAALEGQLPHAAGDELDRLLAAYGDAREEFERLGGYELEDCVEEVTRGLELRGALDQPVAALSGGNKTKLGLARLLLGGGSVLLLDEPTNYLDLPALLWLERWIAASAASAIVVSHDRRFLDRTVGSVLEIDGAERTLRVWPGRDYSGYAAERERERERKEHAWRDQQTERRRIEADIRRTKQQAQSVELATHVDTTRRLAKKVAKKAKAREGRLERQLEEHEVERPRRSWGLDLGDLGRDAIDYDRTVLTVRGLRARYPPGEGGAPAVTTTTERNGADGEDGAGFGGGRPPVRASDPSRAVARGTEVLRGVDLELRGRDRVALLGANGSGKSTLLRVIASAVGGSAASHPPAGADDRPTPSPTLPVAASRAPLGPAGSGATDERASSGDVQVTAGEVRLGEGVRLGYLSQEGEELDLDRSALDVLRRRAPMYEDEARTYLHRFLFAGDEVGKPVRALSYGQRAKLALALLMLGDANVLVLDEPTSHMDGPALEAIEGTLAAYGGPLLVVSHDRSFLDTLGVTRVLAMEHGRLREVGGIAEYEREVTSEARGVRRSRRRERRAERSAGVRARA